MFAERYIYGSLDTQRFMEGGWNRWLPNILMFATRQRKEMSHIWYKFKERKSMMVAAISTAFQK